MGATTMPSATALLAFATLSLSLCFAAPLPPPSAAVSADAVARTPRQFGVAQNLHTFILTLPAALHVTSAPRAPGGISPPRAPGGIIPPRAPGGISPPRAPGGISPPRAPGGISPPRAPAGTTLDDDTTADAGGAALAPHVLSPSLAAAGATHDVEMPADFGIFEWLQNIFASLRAILPTTRAAERYLESGGSFRDDFFDGVNSEVMEFVDGYSKGDPFKNGWRARNKEVVDGVLRLKLTKEKFRDGGSATGGGKEYPYSSAEVRSKPFFGAGCYSTCMKPSRASGVSSSFYSHSGQHDVPPGVDPKLRRKHNEIDVEFVGRDTRYMQTNYFNRYSDSTSSSGTGVEKKHELGFAADDFHVYAYQWTRKGIRWTVDGREVRYVDSSEGEVPSPDYGPMRIAANVWPVSRELEEWAGPLSPNLHQTSASYKWINFEEGADCQLPTHC